MGWQSIFGILSGVLALLFYVQTARGAVSGKLRPNPTSWVIWSFNDTLILVGSLSLGAWNTLWVPIVYAVLGWFIFALALRNDKRPPSRLEWACLLGACVGWIAYFVEGGVWAIVLGSLVNSVGCIPTIRSAYHAPEKESLPVWFLIWFSVLFMSLSCERFEFWLLVFPVSSLLNVSAIIVALLWQRSSRPIVAEAA
jgi:hypothetical protein